MFAAEQTQEEIAARLSEAVDHVRAEKAERIQSNTNAAISKYYGRDRTPEEERTEVYVALYNLACTITDPGIKLHLEAQLLGAPCRGSIYLPTDSVPEWLWIEILGRAQNVRLPFLEKDLGRIKLLELCEALRLMLRIRTLNNTSDMCKIIMRGAAAQYASHFPNGGIAAQEEAEAEARNLRIEHAYNSVGGADVADQ